MATVDTPLLECRDVSKAFGAVQALYRVNFEVRRGEVMALVGDNGAGKSTLIKSVAGIYPFDEGKVYFEGNYVDIHGPRDAAKYGIEVVYQDLALADNLDVVANMFLGRERTRTGIVLDESSMERASRPRYMFSTTSRLSQSARSWYTTSIPSFAASFGPWMCTTSPFRTSKSTSVSACTEPNDLETPRSSSSGASLMRRDSYHRTSGACFTAKSRGALLGASAGVHVFAEKRSSSTACTRRSRSRPS